MCTRPARLVGRDLIDWRWYARVLLGRIISKNGHISNYFSAYIVTVPLQLHRRVCTPTRSSIFMVKNGNYLRRAWFALNIDSAQRVLLQEVYVL